MAVKFKEKEKESTKQAPKTVVLVDEFFGLEAQVAESEKTLKPVKKRIGELRAALSAMVDDEKVPGDQTRLFEGTKADLEFGVSPDQVVEMDLEQIFKILGKATFLKVAKVSVSDLETYLSGQELEKVIKRDRVGTRRIKWIPKE